MSNSILKLMKIKKLIAPIMPLGSWCLRMSPRMITCREFNDFVFDYTEGLLTDEQLKLFERHMKVCPICRNFMKAYEATLKAGEAFFPYSDEKIPDIVPEDLLNAISDVYIS